MCIIEESANKELFFFLEKSLIWLDNNDKISNFHILFILKLLKYLGIKPHLNSSKSRYLSFQKVHLKRKNQKVFMRKVNL